MNALMKNWKKYLLVAFLALAVAGGSFVVSSVFVSHQREEAVYYCPMHPTYTSPKPGNCPICNMKLVKRESRGEKHGESGAPKTAKDICYLHNCRMLRDGKPCPMLVVAKEGEKVTCPICGTDVTSEKKEKTKKILYWTDPMLPGFKADKAGKSPMGMDLIPVYEEAESQSVDESSVQGYAPVLLSSQKQQLIGIATASLAKRKMTKTIRAAGRIAYDPELYQVQAEYLQALEGLTKASDSKIHDLIEQSQLLVESARVRLRLLGLSDSLIASMSTWKEPDKTLILPEAGGKVWLYASIYEFEIPLVKEGQKITAEASAIPNEKFDGVVRSIDPVLDSTTRSVRVRAVLNNPGGALKPQMYVNASIVIDLGEVLAVPEGAVLRTGTRSIVFVFKGQGIFEPREVKIGIFADGFIEVREGIQEGEMVVTSGNFLIDSESRLKGALQEQEGGQHRGH